jgi:hypothetical protein
MRSLAACAIAILSILVTGSANAAPTLNWEGQEWDQYNTSSATVTTPPGAVTIDPTSTTAGVYRLHVGRFTVSPGVTLDTLSSQFLSFTFTINNPLGISRVGMFIEDETNHVLHQVSYNAVTDTNSGIAYNFNHSPISEGFGVGVSSNGTNTHTLSLSKDADGTVHAGLDGAFFASTFAKDTGVPNFGLKDVYLFVESTGTGGSVTFNEISAVPEPATVVSGMAGLMILGGLGWVRRKRSRVA